MNAQYMRPIIDYNKRSEHNTCFIDEEKDGSRVILVKDDLDEKYEEVEEYKNIDEMFKKNMWKGGMISMIAGEKRNFLCDYNRHIIYAKAMLSAWEREYSFAMTKIGNGYNYFQYLLYCEKMIILWKKLIVQLDG